MIGRVKITAADMVLIITLCVLSGMFFISHVFLSDQGCVVRIYNTDGLYMERDLLEDASVAVPGPLGNSVVMIESGDVFMKSSPCPNKICIHAGKIHRADDSIACIPNKVYVIIRDDNEGRDVDSVTY